MFGGLNRTYCDALQDMRRLMKAMDHRNYKNTNSVLNSLVEELQVYGNRMEAALGYQHDLEKLHGKFSKLKDIYNDIQADLPEEKQGRIEENFRTFEELFGEDD